MKTRNTKQKQLVAGVIEAAGRPLTVQEVLALAQKKLPTLGIATVYREIGRLCEAHELHTVQLPGDPPRYEMHGHHHHHFKCTRCNHVYELEGCLADIKKLAPRGFKLEAHEITLYGVCKRCA